MLSLQSLVVEKAGRSLFAPVTFSFGSLRVGLVGSSGCGKTSLARVLAGLDEPFSGSVLRDVPVCYFPQSAERPDGIVDDFLADLWASEGPTHPLWRRWYPKLPPDAPLARLSGGEWMRLRLLALLDCSSDYVILDEPTNHLDAGGRASVAEFVQERQNGLLVISHDRSLLRRVDEIVELTHLGLQRFGGAFDFYWEQRKRQRDLQEEALIAAKRERKLAEREAARRLEAQDKRMRDAARRVFSAGIPKIVAGGLKRQAEETRGRAEHLGDQRSKDATERWREAVSARQTDPFLRMDFENAAPPAGAVHAAARDLQLIFPGQKAGLWKDPLAFVLSGRERWRLVGPNGSGKSTLLRLLRGERLGTLSGSLKLPERTSVYLDQEQSLLPKSGSLLDALASKSRFSEVTLRNELAFYGFAGERVRQELGTLSGGERLRAALACIFLGAEIPQIVLLDEPTNNLDFQSQELLEKALAGFAGLLVVASHDESFAQGLALTHQLVLRPAFPDAPREQPAAARRPQAMK